MQLLSEKGVWRRRDGLEPKAAVRERLNGVCLVGPVNKRRERRSVFEGAGSWRRAHRMYGQVGGWLQTVPSGTVLQKLLVSWLRTALVLPHEDARFEKLLVRRGVCYWPELRSERT